MAKMQIVNCKVLLAGDVRQVVYKRGVTAPEVDVLKHIHGEGSVKDFEYAGETDVKVKDEKERLAIKYGRPLVEEVFPGKNPQMDTEVEGVKKPRATKKSGTETDAATSASAKAETDAS